MALLGFWGIGNGQVPEVCVVSDTPIISNDEANGLPSYAPWQMYPPTNDTIYHQLGDRAAATDSVIVGFWGRFSQSAAGRPWSLQQQGVSDYIVFDVDGTVGDIDIRLASSSLSGGVVATYATLTGIDLDAWNFYEVKWYPHSIEGILKIRINGEIPDGWADVFAADTSISDSTNLAFNLWQRNGATWFGRTSGLYACDSSGSVNNKFLGICRFPYLPVDGDITSDFLGSDGNNVDNFELLDEAPAARSDLVDWVESSTVTDRQVCTIAAFSALGLTGGSVVAAQAVAYAIDPLAGSQSADVGVRVNTTDSVTNKSLAAVGTNYSHLAEVDPETVGWDDASLDGAQVLVEVA